MTPELGDMYWYYLIADTAPCLPQPQQTVPFQISQRLAFPYLVGLIHMAVPIPLHWLFQMGAILAVLGSLLLVASILTSQSLHPRQVVVVLAIVAFNPWTVRPYLTDPATTRLTFMLGLALVLRGLFAARTGMVLLGQLVASLSRQTGLLLLPLIAVWL